VVIGEYAGAWDASDFVVKPRRVGVVKWRRLPETAMITAISALLKGAREMRLTRYRPCTSCGQKNPPEWLAEDDVCPHCATHETDVVH
jgi:hypothetical protein